MPKSTVRDITVISDKPNQLNRPDFPKPTTLDQVIALFERAFDESIGASTVLGDQYPQRNPRISK